MAVALSTFTLPPCPANTANAPWLQAALTVPAVLVQLSLVPAPPTLQVPEPPSITPLFLGPASPSQ